MREYAMNIVYAAEKTSIAMLLGEHLERHIAPGEVRVSENPNQTGSFYVGWQLARFVLAPDGSIRPDRICRR
jgi:hypothetical protein